MTSYSELDNLFSQQKYCCSFFELSCRILVSVSYTHIFLFLGVHPYFDKSTFSNTPFKSTFLFDIFGNVCGGQF